MDYFGHIQNLVIKTFPIEMRLCYNTLGLDICDVHNSPHDTVSCSPADAINAGIVKVLFVTCHVPNTLV